MVKGITGIDILISLFYTFIIVGLVQLFKPKKEVDYSTFFPYFFYVKVLFALIFVLIHSYYYRGGDTFLYFSGGEFFCDQFIAKPNKILFFLNSSAQELINLTYNETYNVFYAIGSKDVLFLSKIIGVINIFTFNSYLASSIIYTLLTAIGVWKLYVALCKIYPSLYKLFAIGILFYPSLGIWGSGILKDPLTLAAVGFMFHSFYNLAERKNILSSILLILFCSYSCFVLKPYILYIFIPIMLVWFQGRIVSKSKNQAVKYIFAVVLIPIFAFAGFQFIQSVSSGAGKYSLENAQSVAEGFQDWHTYLAETRDQSGYNLGEVEFTLPGILSKSPQAFFVTYYRPFIIGDVRNVATLFEAIQALILLLITFYIILKVGIFKTIKLIFTNSDLRVFLLFAIVFGITVGITSYNFGALSRYKIPSVPFFTASLAIIYYLGYLKPKELIK